MQFITQILSTQTLHFTALVKVSESEHSNETIFFSYGCVLTIRNVYSSSMLMVPLKMIRITLAGPYIKKTSKVK